MNQTILWTALPKGLNADASALVVSILVSPRLDPGGADGLLADFPAFVDWPQQALDIELRFGNQAPVAATRLPPPGDSGLWAALFPAGETAVRAFEAPDLSQEKIHSFPVLHVVGFLRRVYAAVGAASPTALPSLGELAGHGFTAIRTVDGGQNEFWHLDERLDEELDAKFGQGVVVPPAAPEPQMDFYRAVHFHRFRGGDPDLPPPPLAPPQPDFHEALALLANHPYLLRRLGLLIDVAVPLDGQPASGTVRVESVAHEFPGDDRWVSTHYLLDVGKQLFTAAPGPGSELADGMLRLGAPDYGLVQLDADGAALKTVQTANQLYLVQQGRRASQDSADRGSLPALRSAGIGVVRTARAGVLSKRLTDAAAANAKISQNQTPELWADDVTRGYRLDVEDIDTGNNPVWRSLCARRATYRIGRLAGADAVQQPGEDEGTVTAAVTQDVDETRNDLFLHETLFHWDGWSLAAPRPGEVIQRDGLSHAEPPGNPSATSLELEVTAEPVAGSLPRLRFGRTYRLRARAVDLAGNSLPLSSADDSQATAPVTYRRFEPVESPAVVIVSQQPLADLPGDSATRPVIRSYNSDPTLDGVASIETAERLLLPPRTAVAMIEQSGLLDTPQGVDGSQPTWQRLADKDAAAIPELIDDPAQIPGEVPYLADPFTDAAVLRRLPGLPPGTAHVTPWDAAPDWWDGRPFRIATIEGSGPPSWDAAARVLTVELPKATIAKVLLSSRPAADRLDQMAVWKWIAEEAFDDEDRLRLRAIALEGRHWMLTPFRELTLVHAVQQPLAPPVIETLDPKKVKIGDTFATLEGRVAVHGASTGKVDLLARWSEPTGFGFATREGAAHACEVPVPEQMPDAVAWGGRRHEFGDAKYRRVDYYAVATTRYREYFEVDPGLLPEEFTRPRPDELPPGDGQYVFSAEVLNSARPLAPNLLYVVPTFGWETHADERGTVSRRRGGLRIYLEEPWFSSGEGELLGVVVWPGPPDGCAGENEPEKIAQAVEVPKGIKPYATQWGRDPIWFSGRTQQVPSLQNFTRAMAVELGLTLEELPGAQQILLLRPRLGVAGHEVGYDEERHLFYCDLEIDAGDTYYPFVRLALVRYQPRSIPHAELSRVVVADFAQFAPDRIAWMAREPEDPRRLRIAVSGTGYRANASFNCASQIEARLERWLGPEDGDLGWVPVSLDPIELTNVQALETLAVWQGGLELPDHPPGARFRVVIEEYESFLRDVPSLKLPTEADPSFGSGRDRRLVYADAVEVDPGGGGS